MKKRSCAEPAIIGIDTITLSGQVFQTLYKMAFKHGQAPLEQHEIDLAYARLVLDPLVSGKKRRRTVTANAFHLECQKGLLLMRMVCDLHGVSFEEVTGVEGGVMR